MPLILRALLLIIAMAGSACIAGGSAGTLRTGPVPGPAPGQTADIAVDRAAYVVGTAFDFRYVRLISCLELVQRDPAATWTPPATEDRNTAKPTYRERRLLRLDDPLLTVWDFKGGGLNYPGLLPHRHSIDLWLRGGTSDILRADNGGFVGAMLTHYQTGGFAIGLTVDRWVEPATARSVELDGLRTFQGDASGWTVGLEVTLAAGEWALDAFQWMASIDEEARTFSGRRRN